jgi:hypothetical protein
MKLEFFHIVDQRNVGDMVSCPALYFDEWKDATIRDLRQWTPDPDRVSIFGGGGLLYHELHDILHHAALCRRDGKTGPIVLWGAGENMHGQSRLLEPAYLEIFDLVGLRDKEHCRSKFVVPCASCLHPEFKKAQRVSPAIPVAIYEHFESSIPIPDIFPRANNGAATMPFSDRLEFLAQAHVVVTNSYHGAYWALLLGRRVLLVETPPRSSRLCNFPWDLPMVRSDQVLSKLHLAKSAEIYNKCVDAQMDMRALVSRVQEYRNVKYEV